jgi:hypothetical protein
MRCARRGHLLALVAALAIGAPASVGTAKVAGGSASGACTTTAGITVVVDFGSAGGGLQVGCAPPPVANGFAALSGAGFPIRNVSSQPGFLCQIDGKPADDPCTHVPSSAHYWSYWYAERGGEWTYSSSGASRTPPPGSVEGWAFGDGDAPRTRPPGPLAATTTTTRATTTPVPSTVTTVPPASAGGATSSTTSVDGSTAVIDEGESTTTSTGTDREVGASVDGDREQAAAFVTTAARDDDVGGSPAGTAVGIAAVLGLVGAGAVTERHRRRSHAEGGD